MPSFILRDLDPTFWARVQAKAQAEGVTLKARILQLLATWLGVVVLACLTVACSDVKSASQLEPSPTTPAAQVATSLSMTTQRSIGATADRAFVTGHVFDAGGKPMQGGGLLVTLTTTAGVLDSASVSTNSAGDFSAAITVQTLATISAVAGAAKNSVLVLASSNLSTPLSVSLPNVVALTGDAVVFQASARSDVAIVGYTWTLDAAAVTGTGALYGKTFATAGTYLVGVTVTDVAGRTATTSATAIVTVPPPAPPAPPAPTPALTLALGCSQSLTPSCNLSAVDETGLVVTSQLAGKVTWDFGDGTAVAVGGALNTHTYTQSGTYLVMATATIGARTGVAKKTIITP